MTFFGRDLIGFYLNESADGGDLAAAMHSGLLYLDIMLIGLPGFALAQAYSTTLRECGQALVPMQAGIAAVVVNLGLNYVLIYGKLGFSAMGVRGAAIATVISRQPS